MVCVDCRQDRHKECGSGTWCDCQHKPRVNGHAAKVAEAVRHIQVAINRYRQDNGMQGWNFR